ncbi:MAG: AtpZ/AtpI family protein [Candidatus Roizmanbacteria bacterium]|nr:AtpZ/AtpI family protein [Candidatus Roizmanbacteria bacterium]
MKYVVELGKNPKSEKQKEPLLRVLAGSNVGFEVLAPIVICLTLGLAFDNVFHVKPVLTVLFLFLGVFGSFYTIYKIIERERNASRKH